MPIHALIALRCQNRFGTRHERHDQKACDKTGDKNNPAGPPAPAVDAVFAAYPEPLKAKLLALRRLIFDTAKTTKGVGALQETLKWGQPSYLTPGDEKRQHDPDRSGEIRHQPIRGVFPLPDRSGRNLSRTVPRELSYGGNRSILLNAQRRDPRSPAAPLRGAGADLSSRQAQDRAQEERETSTDNSGWNNRRRNHRSKCARQASAAHAVWREHPSALFQQQGPGDFQLQPLGGQTGLLQRIHHDRQPFDGRALAARSG